MAIVAVRSVNAAHRLPVGHVPRSVLKRSVKAHAAYTPPISQGRLDNPTVFGGIETLISNTLRPQQPGSRGDWQEVEGCWVLFPPESAGAPEAVAFFLGDAFSGAAPQLMYRLFLEGLTSRNVLVVAVPFNTGFDYLRLADETQYSFQRCMQALGPEVEELPVFGIGHSLGALLHVMINTRYDQPVQARAGNILMGFNNRNATDVIPFLSPFIAPSARMLGPVLNQVASSPLRSSAQQATDLLKGMSPSLLKQMVPLVEQLSAVYMDVSQGKQEFSPSPEDTHNLIERYYAVERNLLLRFNNDPIDETENLAAVLQGSSAVGSHLDLTTRTVPGDHLRPMYQNIVDLPPPMARAASSAASTGGDLLDRLAVLAGEMGVAAAQQPLRQLSDGVQDISKMLGGNMGGPVTDYVQELADECADWMEVGPFKHPKPAHTYPAQPQYR